MIVYKLYIVLKAKSNFKIITADYEVIIQMLITC